LHQLLLSGRVSVSVISLH